MTTDIIEYEVHPASIVLNFEEAKALIEKEVADYDVVVTEDSVADAKKLATALNKRAGEIDQELKAAIAKASAPLTEVDGQRKELVAICKDGRQRILVQVEKFENVKRQRAHNLLEAHRQEYWTKLKVKDEFKSAEFDDLVNLSAITKKGNLAASARSELEKRVQSDKAKQDQTERRLLELENRSYRAGLAAPLSRDHVRPFLFADDETYERELERIFKAEAEREKVATERERQRREREAASAPRQEPAATPPETDQKPTGFGPGTNAPASTAAPVSGDHAPPQMRAPDAPESPGFVKWRVVVTFEVETADSVTADKVCEAAHKRMAGAGITTATDIRAIGSNEDAAVLRPGFRR